MKEISARQHEIIAAAGKILTASGVSGLTIKNLANEMRFTESALYRHYPSKEAIVVAMLEYLNYTLDRRYLDAISLHQSPEEKFIALFRCQFSFFQENPHFAVAVFSDGLMEESQSINETILKIMDLKKKHLLPIITEAQQLELFRMDLPSDELMHIVMGSIRLQMFQWRVSHFKFNLKRKGNQLIQSLLILLKNTQF